MDPERPVPPGSLPQPRWTSDPAPVLAAIAGIAALLVGFAARSDAPDPANVPVISSDGRLYYVLGIMLAGAVGHAVHRLTEGRDPEAWVARYSGPGQFPTTWMVPAVAVFGAVLLSVRYHRPPDIIVVALFTGISVFAAVTVREYLQVSDESTARLAGWAQLGLTTGVAFVALSAIYLFKARALYAAPVVLVISALLLEQVHDGVLTYPIRRTAYALLGAVIVAQASWGLGYWPPAGWYGGGALTAVFLGCALVTGAQLTHVLNRQTLVQRAGAAGALFVACAWLAGQ